MALKHWQCGWCGLCYENRRRGGGHAGCWGYVAPVKKEVPQVVFESKRARPVGDGAVPADPAAEDAIGLAYPTVLRFLTLQTYADGERRVPGSITLFWDAGVLKAAVNDKDAEMSAFVSGAGLAGLLASIEDGLVEDRLDWRGAKRRPGRRG